MIRTASALLAAFALFLSANAPAIAKTGTWIHRKGKTPLRTLFQAELRQASQKRKQVLVIFTADWCAPCKAVKRFLDESKYVQNKVRRGHILYIDVDVWRGPAHRLIPGANPKKLPLLVRVDRYGKQVVASHGTALGLLSEKAVGDNLARLIAGKKPQRPAYLDDPAKRRELQRKEAERAKKRKASKQAVSIEVLARWPAGPQTWRWALKITLRNRDARRRFFAVAMKPGTNLSRKLTMGSYERVGFKEHVRANYFRFYGANAFAVFPVAGNGSITLNAWATTSRRDAPATLTVWELNALIINTLKVPFDKKVAYALKIENAAEVKVLRTFNGPIKVEMKPAKQHTVPLKR